MALVLGWEWPDWVVGLLSTAFIVVGFAIMLGELQRYRAIAARLKVEDAVEPIPTRLAVVLTVVLQVTTVVVLILFLLR